jgi:hypothetical protein
VIRQAHRAAVNLPCQRSRAPRRRIVASPPARRPARRPTCHGHSPPEPGEGPHSPGNTPAAPSAKGATS